MGCTPPSKGESTNHNQSSGPQNNSLVNLKSNTTMNSNPTNGKALRSAKNQPTKTQATPNTIINKRSNNVLGLDSMLGSVNVSHPISEPTPHERILMQLEENEENFGAMQVSQAKFG